jgi:hypothetical protein
VNPLRKPDRNWSACGLVWALIALGVFAGPARAREEGAKLVSSAAGAVTFEVTVPGGVTVPAQGGAVRLVIDGYGTFSPPGAVELPGRAFRVAVPKSGEPRVSWTVLEEERLGPLNLARVAAERLIEGENGIPISEQYYPSDPWAGGGGPALVEALPATFMGRQRVLPVRVNPLILDAGGARLVRRLAITVSFGASGAAPAPNLLGEAPLSGSWKRLYEELLVNPEDVSRFRKPLEPVPARTFSARSQAGKKLKIRIPDTGIYYMRADSLIAAGLSAGLATGEIALKKYYYDATKPDLVRTVDVPAFYVEGAGTAPGVFDGSDRIYFYSLGLKDDAEANDTNALYAADNVLWLEEESAGAIMPAMPQPPPSALDTVRSFTATMKYRTDTWYMKNAVPGTFDFYYATGPLAKSASVPFTLHHPAAGGTFSLTFRLQGNDPLGVTHTVAFSLRNGTGTYPIGNGSFFSKEAKTFTFSGPGLSSSWLVDGQNEIVIACDADYMYLVNDFTVTYTALCIADANRLEFSAEAPVIDPKAIPIRGFTTNSGYLVEITDPRSASYRVLGPSDFLSEGGGYRLVLRIDESLVTRRFVAFGPDAASRLPVRSVSVDAPSNLRETAGSYQALVISHRDFMARSAEYAAWRRGQGYRLLLADVEDVYDEFNGGLPNASAIKRFVTYGFDHWGVEYVLLVGDASEDHKRILYGPDPELQGSPPDYVPAFTYSTSVSGTYDDEVIYSDRYYAFLDETIPVASGAAGAPLLPGGYPDVFIGRLPVGRDVEYRAIINKMNRMETPQTDDAWRRRIVLFSDDAWSGRGTDYMYRSYEQEFEWSTDTCAAAVERSLPGGFDVQRLHLARYTDPIHPNRTESGPAVLSKSTTATRSTFTPALNKALNRGCLWYMFQGHGNRAVLTTESAYSLGWYMDPDSLRIYTPFIFVGVGCHISDFALRAEYNTFGETGPYGDCMSEQLLFKSGAGAVETYASAGFEYLSQNAVLVEQLHKTIFQAPPADSVGPRNEYTGAHWIFGEVIAKAEIEQIDRTSYGTDQVFRYCILGDPMLKIDLGPPVMRLEADSAGEYRELAAGDTLRALDATNLIKLRLTVSDIVAIGRITLRVNGEDSTAALRIVPLVDAGLTYARSYRVDYDYTIDPNDQNLLFQVFSPDGREVGRFELPIITSVRLFYNDFSYEIGPGAEAPPSGTFILTADFPAVLPEAPTLSIDGIGQEGIVFTPRDTDLPLRWKAVFPKTLTSGLHVFTVNAGNVSREISFTVTGNDLVASTLALPNPFGRETNILYSVNLAIESVTIDVYTVSGVLIRSLDPPPGRLGPATFARPHSVLWDGRDLAGDRVANGTYIYVIHIGRAGQTIDLKGKIVKLE